MRSLPPVVAATTPTVAPTTATPTIDQNHQRL